MGNCQQSGAAVPIFERQVAPEKLGKYTWKTVKGYRNACYQALARAEAEKGSPPYVLEIIRCWKWKLPYLSELHCLVGLQELFKNDQILADPGNERFSIDPSMQSTADKPTEFMLFSDRWYTMFPQFKLDDRLRPRPTPETDVSNLKKTKEILLSKDVSRNAELEWVSGKNLRFLDGEETLGDQVAFLSIPRSGNSFIRRILELTSGIYTGSDMNLDLTLHIVHGNLAGEETIAQDKLTWVTKTHWPIKSPLGSKKFSAQKAICIYRNPIDVLASISLLVNTSTHTKKVTVPINEADPKWWNNMINEFAGNLLNKSLLGTHNVMEPEIPTYYIRYEDMLLNPKPVLTELFCFLLGVESIEGTVCEKRIDDYVSKGNSAASVYKLKEDPTKNLSRNAHMFTPEQMEVLKKKAQEYLYFFQYSDHPDASKMDSNTTFFTYDGKVKHDEKKLALYGGFKESNKKALARVLTDEKASFDFNKKYLAGMNVPKIGSIGKKLFIKE